MNWIYPSSPIVVSIQHTEGIHPDHVVPCCLTVQQLSWCSSKTSVHTVRETSVLQGIGASDSEGPQGHQLPAHPGQF